MTVTFPRPSKMLITRLQDGGSMRSTVKLNLADELHSEFVPTEVTALGHVSIAPSSAAGSRACCPQNLDHDCAAKILSLCHDARVAY
jgi:hypothetical protein